MVERIQRSTFTIKAGKRLTKRWNGAGDLISETIETVDRMSGGLVDRMSGGRISEGCAGCDEAKKKLNKLVGFRE